MFCTKCGKELRDQDKFCFECGATTGKGTTGTSAPPKQERLSRPMREAKIGGVCAGFARAFGLDVTLVRVLWLVLTIFPLPTFGVIAYLVCWVVMPKDDSPAPAPNMHPVG